MSIHPVLALLVLFAVPTVVSSSWRPGVERETEEKNAATNGFRIISSGQRPHRRRARTCA